MEKTVSAALMEAVQGLGARPGGGRLQALLLPRNQLQSRAPSPSAPCGEDASEAGRAQAVGGHPRSAPRLRHLSIGFQLQSPPLPAPLLPPEKWKSRLPSSL